MKRILTTAAIAAVAGLTACTPGRAPVTPSAAASESAATVQASPSESSSMAAPAGGVKGACETFNALYAEYKVLPGTEPNAYEDIYLKAQDAKAPCQVT